MEPSGLRQPQAWKTTVGPAGRPVPPWSDSHAAPVGATAADVSLRSGQGDPLGREAAEWGLLAGGVAHDLNNLLCGMVNLIDLAILDCQGDGVDLDDLQEIRHIAEQAVALTDQMLAHSRRTTRPAELVDLNHLVADTCRVIDRRTGLGSTKPRCEFAPTLPAVRANRIQIVQVALNLILNAIDAVGDTGGDVVVRTGIAGPHAGGLGEADGCVWVYLEVSDGGPGIPEEVVDRIFDPFFSTKGGSSGLGLTTVARIVEAHRGRVEVVGGPNRGTTFRVLLPAA